MTPTADNHSDIRAFDRRQRAKFHSYYRPSDFDFSRKALDPYFSRLVAVGLEEIRRHYRGGLVLDLCCGSGHYSFALADALQRVVGIDFSQKMVQAAESWAKQHALGNLAFCVANARNIPLPAESISLLYSFASLYAIPAVEEVVFEIARILVPGGVAILEFGVLHSLNTLAARAASDVAQPCHLPLRRIRKILSQAGLTVERDRSFQILPLWGVRPRWMLPLLHPIWKRIASLVIGGRMLDEWISSLPVLRHFAFRHMMICRKRD